jgi:hypothetical protein
VCVRGVSRGWGGGRGVGRMMVRSDSPPPPQRRHRGGLPFLMPSETTGRLRQRDDAAGGGEGRTLHRGSSDGVSCARGDRQQVSCSAGGLYDRLVGGMKHSLGLCFIAHRPLSLMIVSQVTRTCSSSACMPRLHRFFLPRPTAHSAAHRPL